LRANELATSVLVGGDGMRDAITQHLAALAEETARVVVVAAVFGRSFRLAPLAAALGEPNETVLRALDDVEAARIVRRTGTGTYRFTVPIVRDVLYRQLSASERARLHGAAAKALEEHLGNDADHESLAEIAAHLVEAAPAGDVARAADLSIRAAELAKAAGAHEAAARYATRGLDALRFSQKVDTARQRRLTELTRS
jgi:predicted ATPase